MLLRVFKISALVQRFDANSDVNDSNSDDSNVNDSDDDDRTEKSFGLAPISSVEKFSEFVAISSQARNFSQDQQNSFRPD